VRVALVSGPDPGHLVPMAGLGMRLAGAGHDVVVSTGVRWRDALQRDGMAHVELPLLAAPDADRDFGARLSQRPAQMARPLARALAAFAPELVVADTLTRAGGLAAGVLRVPWAELIPHPLVDPSRSLPPFGTGWRPLPLRDTVLRRLTQRSRRAGERDRAAVFTAAGLTVPAPVVRLVATLPALEPDRPDWPAKTVIVGPLRWEPCAVDLPLPTAHGPLVVVVGTTASAGGTDLLNVAVTALGGTGVRLASPRFSAGPSGLPAWVSAGPGRLGPMLLRASALVAAGGHGMVAAALTAGVPLVLLPAAGDQKEVAARTARAGAAVVASPGTVRRDVLRVLAEPAYAGAARGAGSSGSAAVDPVPLLEAAVTAVPPR